MSHLLLEEEGISLLLVLDFGRDALRNCSKSVGVMPSYIEVSRRSISQPPYTPPLPLATSVSSLFLIKRRLTRQGSATASGGGGSGDGPTKLSRSEAQKVQ